MEVQLFGVAFTVGPMNNKTKRLGKTPSLSEI
jgi:hypothetical protein